MTADIKCVAVVGGGETGIGVASALIDAGIATVLIVGDVESEHRARDVIGRRAASCALLQLAELTVTQDYCKAKSAILVIDATDDDPDVARSMLSELMKTISDDAVIATCLGDMDIDRFAKDLHDPNRVIGLHFVAPVRTARLLEIARGKRTHPHAIAAGFAMAKRLHKIPVVVGNGSESIANRLLACAYEAADRVFMDGSTPWEVDEALVDFGFAVGPYEAQDLVGLDIVHPMRQRYRALKSNPQRAVPIADRMMELGKYGRKSGAGWYRYPGGMKVDDPIVADLAIEESYLAGRTRTDYDPEEIQRRVICAMINETAKLLRDGTARSAADVDLVSVLALHFPRWRGGVAYYADTVGAHHFISELEDLAVEDPTAWSVSPFLQRCAARGLPLASAFDLAP
ncbi:MAG: 3-hydroxyacyl-CoA dehydrogenase family protein [Pseudomonadota bacterium]